MVEEAPLAYIIDRMADGRIILVRGYDEGSVAESDEILEALARLTSPTPGARILMDVRQLRYVPTVEDARHIADHYGRAGARYGYRMAYLATPGSAQFGVTRMVEMLSTVHGVAAAAFDDEDAAVAWLRAGDDGAERT